MPYTLYSGKINPKTTLCVFPLFVSYALSVLYEFEHSIHKLIITFFCRNINCLSKKPHSLSTNAKKAERQASAWEAFAFGFAENCLKNQSEQRIKRANIKLLREECQAHQQCLPCRHR